MAGGPQETARKEKEATRQADALSAERQLLRWPRSKHSRSAWAGRLRGFPRSASDFNYDFHVTMDAARGSLEYNYANAEDLVKAGKLHTDQGELPGLSVFLRDGDAVFHTYSTYQRGLDLPLNTYNFLDMTRLAGRRKGAHEGVGSPQRPVHRGSWGSDRNKAKPTRFPLERWRRLVFLGSKSTGSAG